MSLVLALSLASAPQLEPVVPAPSADEPPDRAAGAAWLAAGALAGATGLGLGLAGAPRWPPWSAAPNVPRASLPPSSPPSPSTPRASASSPSAPASTAALAARGTSRAAATPWISFGGLATASGLVIVAAGLGWQFAEEARASATPWALLQVGLSSVVAGSSMLVYGLAYRKYAPAREVHLALVPTLARGRVGLVLEARF
ncbi:hypothetical protein OV079_31300 [Nannocystis pusilla]|uniref:Uncharacterized protein n=1 Tax=Nannocystis pusilla TaxID=889268 RepID=A0A9X3IZX1_9BACT|nr:hypothetical protein [Nannocystis pusilla]MCY1009971.1 hypothetical protein [Nannocystis pusilla]